MSGPGSILSQRSMSVGPGPLDRWGAGGDRGRTPPEPRTLRQPTPPRSKPKPREEPPSVQPAFQKATQIALEAVGVHPVAARSSKNQRKTVKKEEARARKIAAKQAASREHALTLARRAGVVLGAMVLVRRSRFWALPPSTLCANPATPGAPHKTALHTIATTHAAILAPSHTRLSQCFSSAPGASGLPQRRRRQRRQRRRQRRRRLPTGCIVCRWPTSWRPCRPRPPPPTRPRRIMDRHRRTKRRPSLRGVR